MSMSRAKPAVAVWRANIAWAVLVVFVSVIVDACLQSAAKLI